MYYVRSKIVTTILNHVLDSSISSAGGVTPAGNGMSAKQVQAGYISSKFPVMNSYMKQLQSLLPKSIAPCLW
jgi:hypothetical protein